MATEVPTTTTILTTIKADWTWVFQHLLALSFVALLIVGAVYFVDNRVAAHDAANATKYEQILNTQIQQTAALQKQLAADEAASTARDAAYQATIATLAKSISVRDANAKQQQQVDANLDTAGAAARLVQQTKAAPGEITVQGMDVSIDLPITRNIVADLDSLSAAQNDLLDTQKQLAAQTLVSTDTAASLVDAHAVIASQTKQIAAGTTACNAQITALKAGQRKSVIKSFFTGFIVGFAAGATAHLW